MHISHLFFFASKLAVEFHYMFFSQFFISHCLLVAYLRFLLWFIVVWPSSMTTSFTPSDSIFSMIAWSINHQRKYRQLCRWGCFIYFCKWEFDNAICNCLVLFCNFLLPHNQNKIRQTIKMEMKSNRHTIKTQVTLWLIISLYWPPQDIAHHGTI